MPIPNPFSGTVGFRKEVFKNLFYTDLMTIRRKTETKDAATGVTSQTWSLVLEDQICRLSINGYPSILEDGTHKESNSSLKVFTEPGVDLKEGDLVTLTRNANATSGDIRVFVLSSGKPLIYDSHMEVVMNELKGV